MATKRISSHLILHSSHECISNFFTTFIIHNFIKKRSTNTYTGRCENMWLILKRDRKCQCHIWTSCWWRFAHFWIGARLNHYQYHLIWEPDATEHPLFLIVNCHHNTMVCFSLNFQKSKWNLHQMSKILNSLIWYFDFWKLMDEGNLLNLKILNPILSKILKLIVEAFQNYFYKIKVSKLKWK